MPALSRAFSLARVADISESHENSAMTSLHFSRHWLASRNTACVVVAAAGVWTSAWAQPVPQFNLERMPLTIGMYRIDAQLAATPQQRETGLMMRPSMPQAEGMLFAFDRPGVQCFWMKNTLLPLTAAFLADDGRIVNLADMKPQTTDSHCSEEPVRFVLEMNQGWFERKNVGKGGHVAGAPFAKTR